MRQLIVECVLRSALIGAGTALVLSVLRVKSAAARHAAWAAGTAVMLALPLWTAWGPRASLRAMPAAWRPGDGVAAFTAANAVPLAPRELPPAHPRTAWHLDLVSAAVYLLGAGIPRA